MAEYDLADQLESIQRELTALWTRSADDSARDAGERTLEELKAAVEELHAAAEELRKAGEAVATERRRYAELFDLAPDAYAVTDIDGILLEANQAAYRMLGKGRTLLGKPLAAFLDDSVGLHRRIASLRAGAAGPVSWDCCARGPDAAGIPVTVRVTAARDMSGRTIGFRWIIHDLQQRVAMEERERAASQMLTSQLREHNRRLTDLERTKSAFLRLASHELRSPLAVISGYLSMVLEGDFGTLGGDANKALGIAFQRCQDMAALIDRMLDAARLQDQRIELERETLDLRQLLRDALQAQSKREAERLMRVRLELPERPVWVTVDRAQALKVVRALIDNGLKFSPADARVLCEVGLDEMHARAFVLVDDHGGGVSERERLSLFEPFGRVVTEDTSHIMGTGLGLYLAREIARLHGGDVRLLRSTSNDGSTFVLDLPLQSEG